jgi:hypothetical protein
MVGFDSLAREYEARRFPPSRQLDVHGEGPAVARDRALRWIQSHAHEAPGSELLLILERGGRGARRPNAVRQSVEKLLDGLVGGLIAGWSPFTAGTVTVRIAVEPRMVAPAAPGAAVRTDEEGRTLETAGPALVRPDADIPPELLPLAHRIAELRRDREALSIGLLEVVLRRVWIETQAYAMDRRVPFEVAMKHVLEQELERGSRHG